MRSLTNKYVESEKGNKTKRANPKNVMTNWKPSKRKAEWKREIKSKFAWSFFAGYDAHPFTCNYTQTHAHTHERIWNCLFAFPPYDCIAHRSDCKMLSLITFALFASEEIVWQSSFEQRQTFALRFANAKVVRIQSRKNCSWNSFDTALLRAKRRKLLSS